MTYRVAIVPRHVAAAAFARDEVLHAELRVLEHELPQFRAERWVDERQVADMESTLKWLRRVLKVPTPPEERRRGVDLKAGMEEPAE